MTTSTPAQTLRRLPESDALITAPTCFDALSARVVTRRLSERIGQTVVVDNNVGAAGMITAGRLRPLAVTAIVRSKVPPDVPTLDERGITGFDMVPWFAIFAPRGTPDPVVRKISEALGQAVGAPDAAQEFATRGVEPYYLGSVEVQKMVTKEIATWKTKLQEMGLDLAK